GSLSILPQKHIPKGALRKQSSSVDIASRGIEGSSTPSKLRRNSSSTANISNLAAQCPSANPAPLKGTSNWPSDEKLLIQSLYKVLSYVSKTTPIVLYLRDVKRLLLRSQRIHNLFHKMLKKLSGSVLILGSQIVDQDSDYREVDEKLAALFPHSVAISPREDKNHLVSWKSQMEEGMKKIEAQDNRNRVMEVLSANDLDCDDLDSICTTDAMALSNYIEEIVVSAISYHLMKNKDPEYRNGKLVISSNSLSHGLSIFQQGKSVCKDTLKLEAQIENPKVCHMCSKLRVLGSIAASLISESKGEAETIASAAKTEGDNSAPAPQLPCRHLFVLDKEFEKRIRPEVIPENEINVTFADVGALDEIKESLQELVILPLRRSDLLKGPCMGILLFGPPGTGKTMMAKAIAKESGARFLNVSMSTITSKWFGEDEKNVRGLFTLAAKVSPTIIFVDKADSMHGQRTRVGEHESMRKWDRLLSKAGERILVLGATNWPFFDLDEAIIKRLEQRIMVGLPYVENRGGILSTLLAKEEVDEGLDFKEVA
ncbi:LOW QUALITY PROTEIN: AAA domain-containing protein, partial [Cephalotus follicularis]